MEGAEVIGSWMYDATHGIMHWFIDGEGEYAEAAYQPEKIWNIWLCSGLDYSVERVEGVY